MLEAQRLTESLHIYLVEINLSALVTTCHHQQIFHLECLKALCLALYFFTIYASPIVNIARNHSLSVHTYADDTQLYLSYNVNELSEKNLTRERIELCISDIKSWMSNNKLKLNDDKTELLIVPSKNAQNKIQNTHIQIGSSTISASNNVRNLGIYLDYKYVNGEQYQKSVSISVLSN